MIIDYTFDRYVNNINAARMIRSGQEQFCQTIESYVKAVNDYKAVYPEDTDDFDFMITKMTDILTRVRANIAKLDKISTKVELLEYTRLLNLWFKQLQIEDIEFPEPSFARTNYPLIMNNDYIKAREIFERD